MVDEYGAAKTPFPRIAASGRQGRTRRSRSATEGITWVGLDAHQERIYSAVLLAGEAQPLEDSCSNSPDGLRQWAKRLRQRAPGEVRCCYEAGPLGYGLLRDLEAAGFRCEVVAPGLIPVKPSDRVKTDRRDARKLAELLRGGLLTAVEVPTPEREAVRDLCRAREAVKRDQTRQRHRLSKFLLRRGIRWTTGRKQWTRVHQEWLRGRRLPFIVEDARRRCPLGPDPRSYAERTLDARAEEP